MKIDVDVGIIGASLAGAATAHYLERAGLSCALFDQANFPRRKPCGEGLSILGYQELKSLGLSKLIEQSPHIPYRGFQFYDRSKRDRLELFTSQDTAFHGLGISRYVLDQIVLDTLRSTVVELGVAVSIRELADGSFEITAPSGRFTCRYLVLATGGKPGLPELLNIPVKSRQQSRCGVSVPVKTNSRAGGLVEIFLERDFQACFTWVDTHAATVSFMSAHSSAPALRASRIVEHLKRISDSLHVELEVDGEILGVPAIGKYSRPNSCRNIFLVGDVVHQLDPIGGMGMTHALVGARLSAQAIIELSHSNQARAGEIKFKHNKKIRQADNFVRGYTQLAYLSLVSPVGRRTIGRLRTGAFARAVMKNMHAVHSHQAGVCIPLILSLLANL